MRRARLKPPFGTTFKIWTERPLPEEFQELLGEVAQPMEGGIEPRRTLLARIRDADAIIASARLRYDAALMKAIPNLRVISRTGVGIDNIDLDEATKRGIVVCTVPQGPTTSTAEHAMALLLAVAKRLKTAEAAVVAGNPDIFNTHMGLELEGLTLGLIGLGRIGSRVARLAQAFGMRVIAHDPLIDDDRAKDVADEVAPTIEELLRQSDAVSLHVPLTPETTNLLSRDRIAMMKPGAIIINTARGGIVDEAALLAALDTGRIGGAGLDVLAQEPVQSDNPLIGRIDVVVTPHIAAATSACRYRLWKEAIAQAIDVLEGIRPASIANPSIWIDGANVRV